ncbi:murein biosynthesis integral membrane protein MurJ [Acidaminobacter sp. JC074]|uniref:murein biosynthesis integral membrane protein MurJ n=1 Tax=Acidaminobacter sp. JC074 TaxID=2530199 RepID=UPI001F1107CB|nr:murein biosynthesis integral membrane protein MurJ [Acidaminobacter sp. JC074]MCH4890655.1 murein biosynthesis integral membrane protein MurJ [Acidaminobacter sp. JC074]
MRKTTFWVMVLITVSKMTGLIREITLSYFYGASYISDSFLIALTIPLVIFSFIGEGVSTAYIPTFSNIETKSGKSQALKFTNDLVGLLILFSLIVILVSIFFTDILVRAFAIGFEGETLDLAVRLTKITLIGMIFFGPISVYRSYLRYIGNYTIPSLLGLPMNFFIIIGIIVSSKGNLSLLGFSVVLASIAQLVLLTIYAKKHEFAFKFKYFQSKTELKEMLVLMVPVIISVAVNDINVLVDKSIASSLVVGGISSLNYASKLNQFIQSVFVLSIVTVIYPNISKAASNESLDKLRMIVKDALSLIFFLLVPLTIGGMLMSDLIVEVVFFRGNFNEFALDMTSWALFFYTLGTLSYALRQIFTRVFVAMHDSKTPMINGIISVILNIVLNFVLSHFLGLSGLALATSISAFVCAVLLFIQLNDKVSNIVTKKFKNMICKVIICSSVMGIVTAVIKRILMSSFSSEITLIISVIVGCIVYFSLSYMLKVEELMKLRNYVTKRIKVRKL